MAIKVCQLHLYHTADLHLCYHLSDLRILLLPLQNQDSRGAAFMIVNITQNIALQGNMSCSIRRSLYSYQLHHTAYYYMFKHVIAFLVYVGFNVVIKYLYIMNLKKTHTFKYKIGHLFYSAGHEKWQ